MNNNNFFYLVTLILITFLSQISSAQSVNAIATSFHIEHKPSGYRLHSCSSLDGHTIHAAFPDDNSFCTQWEQINNGNYFHLKNKRSAKFIRPKDASNGSLIELRPSSWVGHWTQWSFKERQDGYGHLVNRATGKHLFHAGDDSAPSIQPSSWQGDYTQWSFNPVESFEYTLTLDSNFTVVRDGSPLDNVSWRVIENGEPRSGFIIGKGFMSFQYEEQYEDSTVTIQLYQFNGKGWIPVSNTVTYTQGITDRYTLSLSFDFNLQRSGEIGENVHWLIERDGEFALQRNASDELEFTYFDNQDGSRYEAWLVELIDGEFKQVSNRIHYEVGQTQFKITADEIYRLRRTGQLGDSVSWVIREDGEHALRRTATNETDFTYFYNNPGSVYTVWLAERHDPTDTPISNIVSYKVANPGPFEIFETSPTEISHNGPNESALLKWIVFEDGSKVARLPGTTTLSYVPQNPNAKIQIFLEYHREFLRVGSNIIEF